MLALEWNLDEGYEDGRTEERESVAIKMLSRGKSFDEVREFTDLPLQRLEQLAKNNRDA